MPNVINIVSEDTFSEKMDAQNAILAAIAANNGGIKVASWKDVQSVCRLGLASKMFSVGDQFVCKRGEKEIVWDIIDFDHDEPVDTNYKHSISLQTHEVESYCMFDAKEAFCVAASNLDAGKYYVSLPESLSDGLGAMPREFTFDVGAKIPYGNSLMLGVDYVSMVAQYYLYARGVYDVSDPSDEEKMFLRSGIEEDAVKLVGHVLGAQEGDGEGCLNHISICNGGSGEWKNSIARQFLNGNTDNVIGWWKSADNRYDRYPGATINKSPYFSDANPFRYGLDEDFVSVLGYVKKRTARHRHLGGGFDETEELFFLPAVSEINATAPNAPDEGEAYDYYSRLSRGQYGKYANGVSIADQWTRTASPHEDGLLYKQYANSVLTIVGGDLLVGVGYWDKGATSYQHMAPICNIV